jgi:hypothetical protein
VRSTDIAEGTSPEVVALTFPTKTPKSGFSIYTQVHLTISPVKGDKAVAFARDLIVRETIFTVREYSSPKAGNWRVKKIGGPEAREQKEREYDDLLHVTCLCIHLSY